MCSSDLPYLLEEVQQYRPDLTGTRTVPLGGIVGRTLNWISAGAVEPSCSVEPLLDPVEVEMAHSL